MNWKLLNPLNWRKSFLILILGGFVFIWFTFIDTYSLLTRYQISERKEDLKAKTRQLEAETVELKDKIEDLQSDSALLERIAREEYGMRKKGDVVYKIREKDN
ncbi:septum formation initiator family protein [Aliifodinibius sp. S!AR15-10]|uniref:FtsB family cell division protein n=1 Tax=Aliifodinibius sp. S!AR15-10 TaxID=2950437 RepID=UPI0028629AA0|nr:septum formation initiator family protein [Aliifodinibius sp. S!AR15-10]MDR8392693.1 septum formation initiator family protein [Aliifodinibius sp. S!AR15-10]